MKKLVPLLIAAIFILCSCAQPTSAPINEGEPQSGQENQDNKAIPDEKGKSEENIQEAAPPPLYNALYYDSVSELTADASSESINEVIEYAEGVKNDNGKFRALVSDLKNGSLYVPYYRGEEMSYRNQEGFSNICLFPSELYNNPWIWYFPDEKQSGIRAVSIMSLSDALNNRESISKLISEIDPEAPNAHNYGEYPEYSEIYVSELQISERVVDALIFDFKEDNRTNIRFVYDGVLVSILTFNGETAYNWLKGFSLHAR